MKLSFEGVTIQSIVDQMEVMLNAFKARNKPATDAAWTAAMAKIPAVADVEKKLSEPWPAPVEKAVEKSGDKRARTEKQLANDERLRAAAAAKKAAGLKPFDKNPAPPEPVENPVDEPELFVDPAEVVRIRQKTIIDLQEAYANGHQQEVFELLSRFGNGAKSFRELPPEAFRPIREAIDKGALT